MSDLNVASRAVRKASSSIAPRLFAVREINEPLGRLVAVRFQHSVDSIDRILIQFAMIAPCLLLDRVFSPMGIKKSGRNWTVCPSFDPAVEHRSFIPDERPRLAIIDQFLEFHRCHRAMLAQKAISDIKDRSHFALLNPTDSQKSIYRKVKCSRNVPQLARRKFLNSGNCRIRAKCSIWQVRHGNCGENETVFQAALLRPATTGGRVRVRTPRVSWQLTGRGKARHSEQRQKRRP